jgi:Fe2+ transport system protein FeoA
MSSAPDFMPLNKLRPGESGRVAKIEDSLEERLASRIMALGFVPGTRVEVVRKAPLGDPVQFELRGSRISLRASEARHVLVERES